MITNHEQTSASADTTNNSVHCLQNVFG